MELYTFKLNSPSLEEPGTFEIQDVIENFESLIWTERYYGDSEVNITLPIEMDLIEKLPLGIFLGIEESNELMILETINIEQNRLKLKGISILSWLNNRFVRTSKKHRVRARTIEDYPPGQILWEILFTAVSPNSLYMDPETTDIPAQYLSKLPIPEIGLYDFDSSGDLVTIAVSFGPLYDEMLKIATTYQIGMQIILMTKLDPNAEQPLGFRSYKGLNKTSFQDPDLPQNPIVRFSKDLDSLQNIRELRSQSIYKTIAFAFAPNVDMELGDQEGANAGIAYIRGTGDSNSFNRFDCRALQVLAEDITGFSTPTSYEVATLIKLLDAAARDGLGDSILIHAVDGDISPTGMFQYGRDYNLGDLVELQGSDGVITTIRVTENIISEEATGEKGYVTYGNESSDITP